MISLGEVWGRRRLEVVCFLAVVWCAWVMTVLSPGAARASSNTWRGTVLSVVAGDTLKILQGKLARTVRLAGVDTPEIGQPFGEEARRFVQGLVQGRKVTVEPQGGVAGKKQRGHVILPDGRDLSLELLKEGLAWHDKRHSPNPFLGELETNARRERLGLWAQTDPVPPWRWRPGKR